MKRSHGESAGPGKPASPEYRTWMRMVSRCNNKNHECYKYYGARGIKVCARWLKSYENFLADIGRKPSPTHSLDRIDNDGDYTPQNCRWATQIEQTNNRRGNRYLTHDGRTQTIAQWARERGIRYGTLKARLDMSNWPVDKALGDAS